MPKDKKDIPKKHGGRSNLPLPEDVIGELREWKRAYELAWSDPADGGRRYTMTYVQLIRRLMEGVKRLDPEVWAVHEADKKSREEQEKLMTDFRRNYWPELLSTRKRVNEFYDRMLGDLIVEGSNVDGQGSLSAETDTGEESEVVNEAGFVFVKGDETLKAFPGDRSPFYAVVNGRNVGFREMIESGWVMLDRSDNVIRDLQEAREIRKTFSTS